MPRRTEGGTTSTPPPRSKPSRPPPKKKKTPPRVQKQATVWAAEQAAWWEARHPSPPPPSKRQKVRVPLAKRRGPQPSLETRYRHALAAPVSREARQKLADTMTPRRRQQVISSQRPYPGRVAPHPDWSRLPVDEQIKRKLAYTRGLSRTARAGQQLSNLAGFAIPGFLGPVQGEAKELASAFPALMASLVTAPASDIAHGLAPTGVIPGYQRRDGYKPKTPGLARDIAVGMLEDIERYTPIQPGGAPLFGPLADGGMERDLARMKEAWRTRPLTGTLTLSALALPPARAISVGRIATTVAKRHPNLSKPKVMELAIKESYRPGYIQAQGLQGGLERTLRADVEGGRGFPVQAKPYATTPTWRAAQRAYDKASKRIDPEAKVVGRFSEQRRAIHQLGKLDRENIERVRLDYKLLGRDLNRYARGGNRVMRALQRTGLIGQKGLNARMAAITTALQGPPGEAVATLTAAMNDLKRVLEEGGKEIPTEARLRTEKQIDSLEDRIRELGLGIDETGGGIERPYNPDEVHPGDVFWDRDGRPMMVYANTGLTLLFNRRGTTYESGHTWVRQSGAGATHHPMQPGDPVANKEGETGTVINTDYMGENPSVHVRNDATGEAEVWDLERIQPSPRRDPSIWLNLRETMLEAGWRPEQIDTVMDFTKHAARVWARQTGNDPTDYLTHRGGANIGAFAARLPDNLTDLLFQRTGWNVNLMRLAHPEPIRAGDMLFDTDGSPLWVRSIEEDGSAVIEKDGQTHTVSQEGLDRWGNRETHISMRKGQRITTRHGQTGTVQGPVEVTEHGVPGVRVITDEGVEDMWGVFEIEPPGPRPFRFKSEGVLLGPKVQNKVQPAQLLATLQKEGVKVEELEELGLAIRGEGGKLELGPFLEGKKSVTKQDVLDYLRYESGFGIEELLRNPREGMLGAGTSYPEYTTTPDHPGYRELFLRLAGPNVGPRTHFPVPNLIAHVRFFLEPEEGNLHIAEIQSDWWNKARDELKAGRELLLRHDPERKKQIERLKQEIIEAEKKLEEEPRRLLGIPKEEWEQVVPYERSAKALRDKMVNDAYNSVGGAARYEEGGRAATALQQTPEFKRLEKVVRIEARLRDKLTKLQNELDALSTGVVSPPMTKWREMVMRRMLAMAVENGFKSISWDGGRVHAVRYGRLDVDTGDRDMSDWEYDHPEPHEDDYQRLYTEAERTFNAPTYPADVQLGLPGVEARDIIQSGQMDVWYPREPDGTYAYERYDERYTPDPTGKAFEAKDGELAGQLVQIVRMDETGMLLRPSGLTRVELRGSGEDAGSSYGDVEVTTTHTLPGGQTRNDYDSYSGQIGSIRELREQHFLDDDWLDELEDDLSSSEEWITDDDAYYQARADWEAEREDAEMSGDYSGAMDVDDINRMDASGDDSGLITLYDEMLPNEVQKLLKPYKVRVEDSFRWGSYNAETAGGRTEEGNIVAKRFEIPDKLAEDVRKGEGPAGFLLQRNEGEIRGASGVRPDGRRLVFLLENGNVDTFLHELVGHGTTELSQRFPQEWAAVEAKMGKSLSEWGEAEHERFARWAERYFHEGKTDLPELKPLLARLREWMRQVYETILMLGRPIPAEARELLDRYLGKTPEGKSVFDEEAQEVLRREGELLGRRKELLDQEGKRLLAQPDAALLADTREFLDTLDPDKPGDMKQARAYYEENARRRYGSDGDHMDAEEKRLLQRQVGWLEDAIKEAADPDSGFNDALGALVSLSEEADRLFRTTILEMSPDEVRPGMERALAKRRNILVNRWRERGLLSYGTGDALGYFPHASIFESLGERLTGPVRTPAGSSLVLGKPRVTRVAARKGPNKLIRWQSGKVNMNPQVLLNTVLARLRLLETREARDILFNIGRPVTSEADVPQGWWVINREGKHIPERLRRAQELNEEQMDDLVAAGEDFDSYTETKKGMDEFLDEYRDSFAREKDRVPPEWYATGELRAVPPEIVRGILPKPFQGKPGGALGSGVAVVNALARISTILQYPVGYILSNVPANLLMQGLTKPSAIFRENARALALRSRNRKLYDKIAREAGDIMAEAGLPDYYARPQTGMERVERRIVRGQRWVGERLGEVADTPWRVGTYLAWARKYGFTSDADLAKLIEGEGNLQYARDNIAQRTRNDMLDFNALSQTERETVSRYFFLWALQKALLKWPITFARDHPVKALALSQFGDEEIQEEHGYGEDLGTARQRSWRHLGLVPMGDGKAVDVSSLNPLGGMELVAAMARAPETLTRGDMKLFIDTLADLTLPQIRELFRDNPSLTAIAESTIPGYKYLSSSLGKSRGSKIWKREDWWDYMLTRNVRFRPEEVDAALVKSQAERERREFEGTTKAEEDLDTLYAALPVIAKQSGYTNPAQLKRIDTGIQAYEYVHSRTYGLNPDEKVALVNEAVRQFYPRLADQLHEVKPTTTEEQKERYYSYWRDKLYGWKNWALHRGEELDLWTVTNGQITKNEDAEPQRATP